MNNKNYLAILQTILVFLLACIIGIYFQYYLALNITILDKKQIILDVAILLMIIIALSVTYFYFRFRKIGKKVFLVLSIAVLSFLIANTIFQMNITIFKSKYRPLATTSLLINNVSINTSVGDSNKFLTLCGLNKNHSKVWNLNVYILTKNEAIYLCPPIPFSFGISYRTKEIKDNNIVSLAFKLANS